MSRNQVTVSICMSPEEVRKIEDLRRKTMNREGFVSRSVIVRRLLRLALSANDVSAGAVEAA